MLTFSLVPANVHLILDIILLFPWAQLAVRWDLVRQWALESISHWGIHLKIGRGSHWNPSWIVAIRILVLFWSICFTYWVLILSNVGITFYRTVLSQKKNAFAFILIIALHVCLLQSWLSLLGDNEQGWVSMARSLRFTQTDIRAVEQWRFVSSILDWEHNFQVLSPLTMVLWLGKKKKIRLLYHHLCDLDKKCIITLNLDTKIAKNTINLQWPLPLKYYSSNQSLNLVAHSNSQDSQFFLLFLVSLVLGWRWDFWSTENFSMLFGKIRSADSVLVFCVLRMWRTSSHI